MGQHKTPRAQHAYTQSALGKLCRGREEGGLRPGQEGWSLQRPQRVLLEGVTQSWQELPKPPPPPPWRRPRDRLGGGGPASSGLTPSSVCWREGSRRALSQEVAPLWAVADSLTGLGRWYSQVRLQRPGK